MDFHVNRQKQLATRHRSHHDDDDDDDDDVKRGRVGSNRTGRTQAASKTSQRTADVTDNTNHNESSGSGSSSESSHSSSSSSETESETDSQQTDAYSDHDERSAGRTGRTMRSAVGNQMQEQSRSRRRRSNQSDCEGDADRKYRTRNRGRQTVHYNEDSDGERAPAGGVDRRRTSMRSVIR